MRPIPSMTRKLFSASGLALATAMAAHAPVARAQSFNGSVAATFGSVTVGTGTGTTTVTVSSPSAVINWTPNDTAATGGPIDFQSAGTTATFTNNPAVNTNFVVLNRIVPSGSTRPIQFNGTVISQIQNAAGGSTPGGTVFFYSPGGILVGSNAVFNVGNLVLTTSDLAFTAGGTFNSGASYVFQQASVAGAQIAIQPGAQITASVDGSYIAMIAPSVVNGGTVSVNGSAALVAADAATIRFATGGLFDIAVDSGTSATGTVLSNSGAITGPAANAALGNSHRIYMVAVPKNDAITMAIGSGSTLGFDIAGAANVVGNKIVLSAGQNVTGGDADVAPSAGGGSGIVSVVGTDANITSNFEARATGGVNLGSVSATGLQFASDVSISGNGAASSLFANAGGAVSIAGSVDIANTFTGAVEGANVTGQSATITANAGGTITIGGNASLVSIISGANAITPGATAGSATGGDLRIDAINGGQVSIAGNVNLTSVGFGGSIATTDATGGSAKGGNGSITASGTSGSSVAVAGTASFSLNGLGALGSGCSTCTPASGAGTGGIATISAAGANTVSIGGATTINANGESGQALTGSAASATGGTININSSAGGSVSLAAVTAFASGTTGFGQTGTGTALGGTINVSSFATGGGGITLSGLVRLIANGSGSSASAGSGAGATSTGGRVYVGASDGTTVQFGNGLQAQAIGAGGVTASGSVAGIGGETTLEARTGGTLSVALGTTLSANGIGGVNLAPNDGSAGTGGLAQVTSSAGGVIQLSSNLLVSANGTGSNVSGDALAGSGIGGTARISGTSGSSLTVSGTANVSATGTGGTGSSGTLYEGGSGTGGQASVELGGATAGFSSTLTVDASGIGGVGRTTSGVGTGGNATINLFDSTLNATGAVYLGAIGAGGNTALTGTGGNGQGGTARVALANSSANLLNTLTLEATGNGGFGAGALTSAASGKGGLATATVNAGMLAVSNAIQLLADGTGGRGVVFGDGGVGTGGTINLFANGDSRGNSLISAPNYLLSANGLGGGGFGSGQQTQLTSSAPGSAGGNAQGGVVSVSAAADGGTISGSALNVRASALGGLGGNGFSDTSQLNRGGNGGIGGSAQGGQVNFDSFKGNGTGSGAVNIGDVTVDVSGTGERGGDAGFGPTRGDSGSGGSGTGGSVNIALDRGGSRITANNISLLAQGTGGITGDCTFGCAATGGTAVGGSINIGSGGTTTGNQLTAITQLRLNAGANGGISVGQAGGSATGGSATLMTNTGLAVQAGFVALEAGAVGGGAYGASPAGSGQGGFAQLIASGNGTVNITDRLFLGTSGTGADAYGTVNTGGTGIGGLSLVLSNGGAITVASDVVVDSGGFGGFGDQDAPSGTGGDGIGGESSFRVGGNVQPGNGGSITVGGTTFVFSDGTGGDGFVAGAGTGGVADIYARQGTITLGQVNAFASGSGGFGTLGGSGGAATGGGVGIQTANAVQGPSQISFTQAITDASAFGGDGSDGRAAGAPGGLGGAAQGGSVVVAGSAGNGNLQAGSVTAFADARGGDGGFASGASGGDGGLGSAGSIQIGTISSSDTGTVNTGSATYGSILASASAFGGAGGNTDTVNPNATGGNGGLASGGGTSLLVRGAPVTITGAASFQASATGGAGGSGPVAGLGGNASIGSSDPLQVAGAYALVTNRFNQPTQRGTLIATDLQFASVATGGAGSTAGTSTTLGNAGGLRAISSNISAGNVTFVVQADAQATGALPNAIALTDSTATFGGAFSFVSTSDLSLTLDQSNLTAAQIGITASNWVLDPVAPTTVGTLQGTNTLSLSSGLDLVAYASIVSNGSLSLAAFGKIDLGSLTAASFVDVMAGSSLTLDDITAGDSIDLSALGLITTGNLNSATSITIETTGGIGTGNLTAGSGTPSASGSGVIGLRSGGNVTTGTITASSDLGIAADGTITIGQATSYDMLLLGGGNIASGGLSAFTRLLIADASMAALGQTPSGFDKELVFAATPVTSTAGSIALSGPVSATSFRAATQSTFTSGAITVSPSSTGSGMLGIDASGAIVSGNLFAAKDITLNSLASLQSGSVTSQTGAATLTAPSINVGAVQAGTSVAISGQNLTSGAVNAQNAISITASNQMTIQSATSANGAIQIASGDILNIGTVTGTRTVSLIAGSTAASGGLVAGQGRIAAGSVQGAGLVQIAAGGQVGTSNVRSTGDNVKIASFGSTVTTGAITAARDVLVSGAQGLTVGANINARDVILLSGGNVSTAGILSGLVLSQSPTSPTGFAVTNAIGRVLIANSSLASGTLLLSTASDFSALFVAPVSLLGSVNVTGQVVAGQFRSYSQGNMTGAAIAAFNSIEVESGGLITAGQRWGSPTIELVSADIQIVDNGALTNPNGQQILSGLRTSATGEIDLISISGRPALIGDGLNGTGYSLSAAEIGLISTHELFIGAVDVATNPIDMFIGNLALTAGGTNGSTTIGDATGAIHFVTGNRETELPGGAIRVVGNVAGSGLAQSNVVEFNTGRFEIDAATGSVALTQSGTTLGGTVEIHASNIHVANAGILDKLAADPFYAGHIAELNAPAAVQRPDGVLRALGLDLYPTGTLYVQNTGTILDPAGFFADIDLATINTTANTAPASISIIVNGKWQTPTGVVSGFAARDLVVSASDVLSFFTPDSTINGCAISASTCVPEMTVDPVPAISSQIQIISNDALGNTPTFTAEPESSASPAASEQQDKPAEEAQTPEEAASEADDAASPIAPPPQIIDSTPLEPQQQVEQPVAGSGNPSLIGSVVNENSAEGDAQ
ncbi:hypothetical protein GGQ88_002001 [Novosphingobium hassiacum]|uniref:Filamentous hemagglutinin N-terminal domain-containing protein n=1 Tax=Novosphingobium hassiacum TaxID=173676 RepID=A0A7W6EVU9_9SPHN|nr:S-layer family protein [Novosphingobium hassiacum]MBB3860732.1 hypothetical protein [Novosphingobium hassiacum]